MSQILCAIDLTQSATARALLKEAARQADLRSAKLTVMTVLPDYGNSFVASFFPENAQREAIAAANASLHSMVAETLPGRRVQHIVEMGVVYEKVLELIERLGANFVVIGAHRPNFTDRLQGPNSARIARGAPCSVLILRD